MTFALRFLGVFLLVGVVDLFWARYTVHAAARHAIPAALYSAGIHVCSSLVILAYVGDPRLIVASVAGGFVGTMIGTRR